MKKLVLFVALALFLFLYYYNCLPTQKTYSIIALLQTHYSYPASKSKPVLKLHSKYNCLMDATTNRVLYGTSENEQAAMASTTKIMTCLLSLENGKDDQVIEFSQKASSMPKVHLGVKQGTKFYLKDLRYSLMLKSHNDTAMAIAEGVAGSKEKFAQMMNVKAKKLGMTHTNFVTPNGLDADGHYSTPRDMCRLASYAIKNKRFLSIVAAKSYSFQTASGKRNFSVSNSDAFLSQYPGALGLKTGFTGKAGYCFVGAATRNNVTLTSTVLACGWPPNKSFKWKDTNSLMDFGYKNFTPQIINLEKVEKLRVGVEGGKESYIALKPVQNPTLLLSPYDSIDITYNIPKSVPAPVEKNKAIGSIRISINKNYTISLPVYSYKSVGKTSLWDGISFVFSHWAF